MPRAPEGVAINAVWVPKRGRQHAHRPRLTIKQIHRGEGSVSTDHGTVGFSDLRKYWKPEVTHD